VIVAAALEYSSLGAGEVAEAPSVTSRMRVRARDERAIVRDEHDGAVEREERLDQRLDRLEIEWLVGSSSTSTLGRSTMMRQKTSRAASAAGERADALLHVLTGEEHAAELTAHVGGALLRDASQMTASGSCRIGEDLVVSCAK